MLACMAVPLAACLINTHALKPTNLVGMAIGKNPLGIEKLTDPLQP